MKLKSYYIFTSVLLVISIFVYNNENKRGTDLLSGSYYIKGLDIEKVRKIVLSFKDAKSITLARDLGRFVLENYQSYPAATDKVNDLIYKIASIQVGEKISSDVGEEGLKKYELDDQSMQYRVDIFDSDNKKVISFKVGRSQKGKGNYLLKEGKNDVYLSKETLSLNPSYKDLLNTTLLDINEGDIERVSIESDTKIEFAKSDNDFVVESPKNKNMKKEKVAEYVRNFRTIKFDEFLSQRDRNTQSLNFDRDIKIQLKNKLVYKLSLARDKGGYFMKLNALVGQIPQRVVISKDDDKEKLQNVENMVRAQETAQRFNIEKASWIYKVNKDTYEKIAKDSKFFL